MYPVFLANELQPEATGLKLYIRQIDQDVKVESYLLM